LLEYYMDVRTWCGLTNYNLNQIIFVSRPLVAIKNWVFSMTLNSNKESGSGVCAKKRSKGERSESSTKPATLFNLNLLTILLTFHHRSTI
jgi:hypothetical protein